MTAEAATPTVDADPQEHFRTVADVIVDIIASGILGEGTHNVSYVFHEEGNPNLFAKVLVDDVEWTRMYWKEDEREGGRQEGDILVQENSPTLLSVVKQLEELLEEASLGMRFRH